MSGFVEPEGADPGDVVGAVEGAVAAVEEVVDPDREPAFCAPIADGKAPLPQDARTITERVATTGATRRPEPLPARLRRLR